MTVQLADWLSQLIDNAEGLSQIEVSEDRIRRAYKEMLSGYETDPSSLLIETKKAEEHEGIIVQRNIAFCSVCPHHFLPYFGSVAIAYDPGEIIIGLGKLGRLVTAYARRLQIQEDMARYIAEELISSGKARGAYVLSKAQHLCMCARGPKNETTETIATYKLGTLADAENEQAVLKLFQMGTNL